jgi:uncharacterized protein with HEPN domain
MSKHDPQETLRQILDFCAEARGHFAGKTQVQFSGDLLLQRTGERLIELMGEAASRLPESLLQRHPEVPWEQIIGMRHRLIHGYDALDYDIVWAVIEKELEPLARQVEAILRAEFPLPAPPPLEPPLERQQTDPPVGPQQTKET